ncbi:MAG TPA: CGNR zinc finger domain-containing protein [Terriglobales bacterium]
MGNHACLDFINTAPIVDGQPVDLLATFSDLLAWIRQAQLLPGEEGAKRLERQWAGEAKAQRILEQAQAFRGTLREMVERIAAGKPVPQAAVEAINELLKYRLGRPQLTRRKDMFSRDFRMESEDAHQVLGLLAEAASDLLCSCDFSLIRKCQNPACVLFFYDTSKNHARQWCSMSLCGNRSKVAAHYHRHRTKDR